MFLKDLHPLAQSWKRFLLCGLVASALFQTDLLPFQITLSGPSVNPGLLLPTPWVHVQSLNASVREAQGGTAPLLCFKNTR